jgi:hypothetical protein
VTLAVSSQIRSELPQVPFQFASLHYFKNRLILPSLSVHLR